MVADDINIGMDVCDYPTLDAETKEMLVKYIDSDKLILRYFKYVTYIFILNEAKLAKDLMAQIISSTFIILGEAD